MGSQLQDSKYDPLTEYVAPVTRPILPSTLDR